MTRLLARREPLAVALALLSIAVLAWATPGAFGGYTASIRNGTDTAGTAAYFQCTDAYRSDRATAVFQWSLNDTNATTADLNDTARNGTHVGGTSTDATPPIACPRDPGTSWSLDGSSQYASSGIGQLPAPNTFTLEVWFRTAAAQGKLIGLGSSTTGVSVLYDRHLYIDSGGFLVFGVFPNAFRTLVSPAKVTDDVWHHAVATLSTAGMVLYLDGRQVAADPSTTTAQSYGILSGYWRVGYDTLATWPNAPASAFFKGRLRFAAVYSSALTAAQVARHYAAGV